MKSLYQRIKGKSVKDFIVHGKRWLYLKKVQRLHQKYGEEYFFSDAYVNKYIDGGLSDEVCGSFIKSESGMFGDTKELNERLSTFVENEPKHVDKIVSSANIILAHKFDLLGSGPILLNYPATASGFLGVKYDWGKYRKPKSSRLKSVTYKEIDWHIDFKSGYRWDPDLYYPVARNYTKYEGADIKVPWELSRGQHLPTLGLAFIFTKNELYAEEILSQLIDWIENNPLCKGPNWNCTMDVGIRVSNWLVALELIRSYKSNSGFERIKIIIASLIQHFDYLWNNFEWTSKLTSNHYLSNLAGFLFCIVYLPKLKRNDFFSHFVKKEFELEIHKQMYFDGMNSEGSLPYHRLVMELFAYSGILAKKNDLTFNSSYYEQLNRSFDFTTSVIKPNGEIPQIGDNDSGIFLKLYPRSLHDLNYLNALAEIICNRRGGELCDKTSLELVLFDKKPENMKEANRVFRCFKESGVSIIRNDEFYFSFYHGENGQKGNGGHCHNDRLSFTLFYKNQDIFIDPGTGVYTSFPQIRNEFRSTRYHNTVGVSGREQNDFHDNGNLFAVKQDITRIDISSSELENVIELRSSHNGYEKLITNTIHKRDIRIDMSDKVFTILDRCNGENTIAYFIVRCPIKLDKKKLGVDCELMSMTFEGATDIYQEECDYSESYGNVKKQGCTRLCVHFYRSLTTKIVLH